MNINIVVLNFVQFTLDTAPVSPCVHKSFGNLSANIPDKKWILHTNAYLSMQSISIFGFNNNSRIC